MLKRVTRQAKLRLSELRGTHPGVGPASAPVGGE